MSEAEFLNLKKRNSELEGQIEDLTESKEAFEAITGAAEDSIFIKDIDFRYTFVNPAMERTLGVSASELIGKTPLEVFGEDEARIIASVDKPVLEGQTVNAKRQLKINGDIRTFHIVQTPILDSNGKVKAICGIVRDVTLLQNAEDSMRESEERFHSLISRSPVGIFQADVDGNRIYVNEQIYNFTGMNREEHYGNGWTRAIHPDDREKVDKAWQQTIKSGSDYSIEYRLISQDEHKKTTWVSGKVSALIDKHEKIIGFMGTLTDITERKKAEDALREAKVQAEHLIETANAMVIGLDTDGDITLFNEAAEQTTGYSFEELKYKNWFEVIVPQDIYPEVWEQFEKLMSGGLPRNLENPILTKTGEERYIAWQNSEVREKGKIVGTISFGIDITERKRAEVALGENERLMRKMAENYPNSYISIIEKDYTVGFSSGQEFKKQNLDPAKFTGLSLEQVFGDKATIVRQHYEKTFKGKESTFELFINEQHQLYRAVPLRSLDGSIPRILVVVENITERKQAEERLRLLSIITEQVTDSVIMTDRDFKITYSNKSFRDLYGYSNEEVLGRSPDFLNIDSKSSEIQTKIYKKVSAGEIYKGEALNRRSDGSTFSCEMIIFPLVDENGDIFAYAGYQRDITERKTAAEALTKSEKKLRAYNEELRLERRALYLKNIALKEVLKQIAIVKEQMASQIKSNINRIIMPIINGLANKQPGDMGGHINLLKSSLLDIASPFIGHLESEFSKLASRQIEICNMVKSGMSSKEIAASLNLSVLTVLKQRTLIRKKLGISNEKINLASYLQSMSKTKT